jgi:hypothetical protein
LLFYAFFVLFYVFFCVVLCDVCFVTFPVLFVCICVLNNCHRVATQLQLKVTGSYLKYIVLVSCIPLETLVELRYTLHDNSSPSSQRTQCASITKLGWSYVGGQHCTPKPHSPNFELCGRPALYAYTTLSKFRAMWEASTVRIHHTLQISILNFRCAYVKIRKNVAGGIHYASMHMKILLTRTADRQTVLWAGVQTVASK